MTARDPVPVRLFEAPFRVLATPRAAPLGTPPSSKPHRSTPTGGPLMPAVDHTSQQTAVSHQPPRGTSVVTVCQSTSLTRVTDSHEAKAEISGVPRSEAVDGFLGRGVAAVLSGWRCGEWRGPTGVCGHVAAAWWLRAQLRHAPTPTIASDARLGSVAAHIVATAQLGDCGVRQAASVADGAVGAVRERCQQRYSRGAALRERQRAAMGDIGFHRHGECFVQDPSNHCTAITRRPRARWAARRWSPSMTVRDLWWATIGSNSSITSASNFTCAGSGGAARGQSPVTRLATSTSSIGVRQPEARLSSVTGGGRRTDGIDTRHRAGDPPRDH